MIRKRKRDGNCTLADAQRLGITYMPHQTVMVWGQPALVLSAHALAYAHVGMQRHAPAEFCVRGDVGVHYVVQFKDKRRIVVPASDIVPLDRPAPDLTWLGKQ